MSNWQEHIESLLNPKFERTPTGIHGETVTETYMSINPEDQTCIKVGYLTEGELIYIQFENPRTPGFTEQQNREYFYRHTFDTNNTYGPPGLMFNKQNKEAIEQLLQTGLNGKEIQHYSNSELVKSEIFYSYGTSEPTEFGTTITFKKRSFWNRLFSKADEPTTIKEIQLNEIFAGTTAL
ncbi:MAG: hypothetical protein ABJ004_15230 [Cyclobacteriaceae bacterium]